MNEATKKSFTAFFRVLRRPGYVVFIALAVLTIIVALAAAMNGEAFLGAIFFSFSVSLIAGIVSSVIVVWYSNREIVDKLDELTISKAFNDVGLVGCQKYSSTWEFDYKLLDKASDISWCFLSGQSVINDEAIRHFNLVLERRKKELEGKKEPENKREVIRLLFADPRVLSQFNHEITVGFCTTPNLLDHTNRVIDRLIGGIDPRWSDLLTIGFSKSIPTSNCLIYKRAKTMYIEHTAYLQDLESKDCVHYSWKVEKEDSNPYIDSFELAWKHSTKYKISDNDLLEVSFYHHDSQKTFAHIEQPRFTFPDYHTYRTYSYWAGKHPDTIVLSDDGNYLIALEGNAKRAEEIVPEFLRPLHDKNDRISAVYLESAQYHHIVSRFEEACVPCIIIRDNKPVYQTPQ